MLGQAGQPSRLQPAIRGKITDLLDCPVASAKVVLSGAKLEDKLNSTTGLEGIFMFCRIPPGSYTIEVSCNGFNKLVQRGIAVRDRTITGLDLKMDFLEDSRTLNLRSMSLAYFRDDPPPDSVPSDLSRELSAIVAELSLGSAFFNPPAALEVGQTVMVELGVYQDLTGEVMRRLLERHVCGLDRERIGISLAAQLSIDGCDVSPIRTPPNDLNRMHYLDWAWKVIPTASGAGRVRLRLDAVFRFGEYGVSEKCLLHIDRAIETSKNRWPFLRHWMRKRRSARSLAGNTNGER